jgi:hypothetical protein
VREQYIEPIKRRVAQIEAAFVYSMLDILQRQSKGSLLVRRPLGGNVRTSFDA